MPIPDSIILGSQSPRRLEILTHAGFSVQVISPNIDEVFPSEMSIYEVPEFLANLKMQEISNTITTDDKFIICADTVVIFNQQLIGKPTDDNQSFTFLKNMNGKQHDVITGVSIRYVGKQISFAAMAKVFFKKLSDEEIWHYIHTHQTLDKAGAYNIQEYCGIDRIEGEFENVMGLPIRRVLQEIQNW
jgi:septum formation protein